MVSYDVDRLLRRAELFDKLAANITDALAIQAAREMAREHRERAEQLTVAAASNKVVEVPVAPSSEGGPAQGTGEDGSVPRAGTDPGVV